MKKRKLKDLKENECIKVNTLKEAKYLSKKLRFGVSLKVVEPKVILNYEYILQEDGVFYHTGQRGKELPASEFIKPKKPKKWKESFKEIARLDGEVNDLKEKINTNLVQDIYDSMPIKDPEATEYLNKHSTDCRKLHVKYAEDVTNQYIDWSFPGQAINISYGFYSSLIVTSGKHEGDCFEGLCIRSTKDSQVGTFGSEWSKNFTKVILKKY